MSGIVDEYCDGVFRLLARVFVCGLRKCWTASVAAAVAAATTPHAIYTRLSEKTEGGERLPMFVYQSVWRKVTVS
jgi:hypothetical protein